MISIEDFRNIGLKIAVIEDVQDHPHADRLYVITVRLADETRKIVAGIKPYYERQHLVGKQVVLVSNLAPAVVRGVESQGMLLAAADGQGVSIIGPDKPVATGCEVR